MADGGIVKRNGQEQPYRSDRESWRSGNHSRQNLSPTPSFVDFFEGSPRKENTRNAIIVSEASRTGLVVVVEPLHEPYRPPVSSPTPTIYGLFKNYSKRSTENVKAFKLTHPKYGLLHLVNEAFDMTAFSNESGERNLAKKGIVIDLEILKLCLTSAISDSKRSLNSGNERTEESDEKIWDLFQRNVLQNVSALNCNHIEEASAAEKRLPSLGMVTIIAEIEQYFHDILGKAFDIIYSNITSVISFEKIWPELASDDVVPIRPSPFQNPIKIWLSDDKNITKEFREIVDACSEMVEYQSWRKSTPTGHRSRLETQFSEYNVEIMYQCMKGNAPKFTKWMHLIFRSYKDECLHKLSTRLNVLDRVASVVAMLAEPRPEIAAKTEDVFRSVFNEILANYGRYHAVLLTVTTGHRKKFYRFDNENILQTIGLPDDYPGKKWWMEWDVPGTEHRCCCELSDKDKLDISTNYRQYDGWPLWFEDDQGPCRFLVRPANVSTMRHLIVLFYEIQRIFTHGHSELDGNKGVLADDPEDFKLIVMKDLIQKKMNDHIGETSEFKEYVHRVLQLEEGKTAALRCKQYLLRVWQDARNNKDNMKIDYYDYFSIHKFFRYLASLTGQALSCCIWKLSGRVQEARFALHQDELTEISERFFTAE